MCGLVAVIGPPGEKLLSTFELLLSSAIVRGLDSTGVAMVVDNKTTIVKDVVWPLNLIHSPIYQEKIVDVGQDKAAFYFGHTRWQTRGSVSKANAHPFRHGHITMVHNGTLDMRINHKGPSFDTDSEGICKGIAERSIEEVWYELDGAAALIFWDEKKKSLFTITNGKRPMLMAATPHNGMLLVASEEWQLRGVARQLDIKLHKGQIYTPGDHELWEFKWDGNKVVEDYTKLRPKPLKAYTSSVSQIWDADKGHKETQGQSNFLDAGGLALRRAANQAMNSLGKTTNTGATGNSIQQGILEKDFLERYPYCRLCWESLNDEYLTAFIIDDEMAVCRDCTNTAKDNNMLLTTHSVRGQG